LLLEKERGFLDIATVLLEIATGYLEKAKGTLEKAKALLEITRGTLEKVKGFLEKGASSGLSWPAATATTISINSWKGGRESSASRNPSVSTRFSANWQS